MMLQQIIAQAAVTLDQWEQISKLWEQQNQLFKAFKRAVAPEKAGAE